MLDKNKFENVFIEKSNYPELWIALSILGHNLLKIQEGDIINYYETSINWTPPNKLVENILKERENFYHNAFETQDLIKDNIIPLTIEDAFYHFYNNQDKSPLFIVQENDIKNLNRLLYVFREYYEANIVCELFNEGQENHQSYNYAIAEIEINNTEYYYIKRYFKTQTELDITLKKIEQNTFSDINREDIETKYFQCGGKQIINQP